MMKADRVGPIYLLKTIAIYSAIIASGGAEDEALDVVLAWVDDTTDAVEVLICREARASISSLANF